MAVAVAIAGIYFFGMSVYNFFRIFYWLGRPKKKFKIISEKGNSYHKPYYGKPSTKYEYIVQATDEPNGHYYSFFYLVNDKNPKKLKKGNTIDGVVNDRLEKVISLDEFSKYKKNLFIYPGICVACFVAVYLLIFIASSIT